MVAAQTPPPPQRGHAFAPPQSIAVSTPFLTPSVQDGAAQTLATHDPLTQSVPVPQPWPVGQRTHVLVPPQLTPDSSPFLTVSVHEGTAQVPAVQTPLRQLAAAVPHRRPSAHFFVGAHDPPQSTSVSLPLRMLSPQDGAVQVKLGPQFKLTQSPAIAQVCPSAHRRGVAAVAQVPPQSMEVSVPFLTVSKQVGATHNPAVHTPLTQLAATVPHILPTAQAGQLAPPQSTSVSVPFRVPSVHAADAHSFMTHTPLVQSTPMAQVSPSVHLRGLAAVAQAPPQSTSVSVPFLTVSRHVGIAQVVAGHTPLTQFWPLAAHILPSIHSGHVPPPQSTSDS